MSWLAFRDLVTRGEFFGGLSFLLLEGLAGRAGEQVARAAREAVVEGRLEGWSLNGW
jgi:hypothetical protein